MTKGSRSALKNSYRNAINRQQGQSKYFNAMYFICVDRRFRTSSITYCAAFRAIISSLFSRSRRRRRAVGKAGRAATDGARSAAPLRSPCLLPGGWRPRLLLFADFNLVSGHVRAPRALRWCWWYAGSQPRANRESWPWVPCRRGFANLVWSNRIHGSRDAS